MDPYAVLGVPKGSDDATIRAAYLDAVRRCPPEHDARGFAEIQQAWEVLHDRRSRLRYALFSTEMPAQSPLDAVRMQLRHGRRRTPPTLAELKEMLRRCATVR
ncbi:MAG: DnaJ domain-containing protein [Chitinivibrionales bacterium]|nr:DnaJ domain-containing protein [Chitinivibrionales bacterium]